MSPPAGRDDFATTHWSLVLAAVGDEASRSTARRALEQLCRSYWYPLYAFVRYSGHDPEEARDLTQAFFARLLEKRGLAGADPQRGRFRSYLLGALKHFLTNEWHRARTRKRGGEVTLLELDALEPEARYALTAARSEDPDAAFDREWAEATVAGATAALTADYEGRGKGPLLEALRGSLTGDEPPRAETAERLGMSEGAVKVAVHRLRRRYRELLRAEVARTVDDPSEVDDEMRHLVAALRSVQL